MITPARIEEAKIAISHEQSFDTPEDALDFAVKTYRESNDALAVETDGKKYYTIHSKNSEQAIWLNFKLVFDFSETARAALSGLSPMETIKQFREEVRQNHEKWHNNQ